MTSTNHRLVHPQSCSKLNRNPPWPCRSETCNLRSGSSDRFFMERMSRFVSHQKKLAIFGRILGGYIFLRLAGSVSFSSSTCSAWNSKMFQHPNDNSWLNPSKPASHESQLPQFHEFQGDLEIPDSIDTHRNLSLTFQRKKSIKLRGFFRRLNSI